MSRLSTPRSQPDFTKRTNSHWVLDMLQLMGLAGEVEVIADPGLDRDGLALMLDSASKRVYLPRKVADDF